MSVLSQPLPAAPAGAAQAPARAEPASRSTVFHALVVVGLLLAAAGAAMPWLLVYNGLTAIPGYRLGGMPLAGLALVSAGLVLVAAHRGGGRLLRPVAGLAGAVVVVESLVVAHGVLGYVADPGPAGPLLMPQAGFGAYVMAAGGVSLVAAALVAPTVRRSLTRLQWVQLLLAAVVLVAGWIHLLLAPEHLEEQVLLGAGFIVVGIVQVLLAVAVVARPSLMSLSLVVMVSVAVMAVYLYAVVIGLPFAGDAGMAGMAGMDMHDDHGLVLGAGEPVDLIGAGTFLLEVFGVAVAVGLLRYRARGVPTAS